MTSSTPISSELRDLLPLYFTTDGDGAAQLGDHLSAAGTAHAQQIRTELEHLVRHQTLTVAEWHQITGDTVHSDTDALYATLRTVFLLDFGVDNTLFRSTVIEPLHATIAAIIATDDTAFVDALEGLLENASWHTTDLCRFLAAAALWDAAGRQRATTSHRNQIVNTLHRPGGMWDGFFDAGVLEAVVDVLSGDSATGQVVPEDQMLCALLAIAADQLDRPNHRWRSWEEHYRHLVTAYTRARTPNPTLAP